MIFYSSSYQPDACCSIVRNESAPAYLFDGLRCCPLISSSWFSFARFWFKQSCPPQKRTLEAHRRDANGKAQRIDSLRVTMWEHKSRKYFLYQWLIAFGALGGTRTPTMLLTATSRQRVYQFRHERIDQGAVGTRPRRRRRCNKSALGGQGRRYDDSAVLRSDQISGYRRFLAAFA
jgi:hypothetical protein